jgi:YjbE family integral membrane protein
MPEMELFSAEFLSALAAIVVIDLVLAGDNAIVIALAARSLPPHLRGKAIVWGTFGAIAVRTAMTLAVVWLLKIPGLLLIGGSLLVWIAYKLVIDSEGDKHHLDPATNFWGAMKTIVVADALMGLDNVLAVAGAAQGSFLLVVLGLLISIPIVIWGSQLILKWVVRYPAIVYIGAGVLAWTAVKMMTGEPILKEAAARYPVAVWAAYITVIGGVLTAGFMANRGKARTRVAAHLVDVSATPAAVPASMGKSTGNNKGGIEMVKILIPVDGSANALKAVQYAVNRFMANHAMEIHLLHVRTPLTQNAARFISKRNRAAWHREEADKALRSARGMLDSFGVPHAAHVELGDKAAMIDRVAQRLHVNQIVMGTARKNSLTRLIEDSVTNRVLELTRVPVEVVAGESISRLERIGVPAGIGAALALLYATVD